jgi:CheY-like chemotaxis protein
MSTVQLDPLAIGLRLDDDREPAPGPSSPHSAPRDRSKKPATDLRLTVLFVDDVADTRLMYQRFFEWQGARVITAADGVGALQAVLYDRPDVIVLDLAMPKITGWEVLQILKKDARSRRLPVLVLSGQNARDSAMDAGADVYLEKPCRPDALLAEIQRLLREPSRRNQ